MPERPRLYTVEMRSASGIDKFDTYAVSEEKAKSNACFQYARKANIGIGLVLQRVKQGLISTKILYQAKAARVIFVNAETNLPRESPKEYAQRIVQLGIKLLGTGTDAVVFQHPEHKNIAVKLVTAKSWHMRWIRWAQKNQHNKFVPRIHALYDVTMKGGKRYGLLFTDFLTPCTNSKFVALDKDYLSALDQLSSYDGSFEYKEQADLWLEHIKDQLPKDLVDILAASFAHGHLDLNVHNVGMSGSQLIISDPWGPLQVLY